MKAHNYKGEWKASDNKVTIPVTREASNIIKIEYGSESTSQEDIAALIAAAPELLKSSKDLLEVLKHYNLEGITYQLVVENLENAIKKATK